VEKFRTWLTLRFQQVPDTAPKQPDTPLGHLQRTPLGHLQRTPLGHLQR
jgi:hypothetical protein